MSEVIMIGPIKNEVTRSNAIRFHISLNVANIARSVEFFRNFFAQDPAKQREDYAKFELEEPPVVLSLEPFSTQPGGNLNHLGFRMPNAEKLVEFQRRLEMAGISTRREEGVECCYARQTKFWVHDPDGNMWEIYTFEGDIEHRGAGQSLEAVARQANAAPAADSLVSQAFEPAAALWTHRLGERLPKRLPINDDSVDLATLQGTFNDKLADGQQTAILKEIQRVLRPGGELSIHVLSASSPLGNGPLQLPGPAAIVRHVPIDSEIVKWLEDAGFSAIQFTKLGDTPCFTVNGVEMRETKLAAYKSVAGSPANGNTVLYKGPFRKLVDDDGNEFCRGQRIFIDDATWNRLRNSSARDSFLFESHS